jgi:2,5-diketo-D-gluconate reductase A
MASAKDAPSIPNIDLGNDISIPQLGFGVFLVPPEITAQVVTRALAAGYRHIDTATGYRNERGVGEAVRGIGMNRDDVFITTKCLNDDHGYDNAIRALETSLRELGLDYVDLYLIHWPVPAFDRYAETWEAFISLRARGLTRAIGVSNFQPAHLDRIVAETGVTPSVNQIELHPRLQQEVVRRKHAELGIVTEAWSPLAQGLVLDAPTITEIAAAHGKTSAQVVIRWHLELGNVVIPKSVTPERIDENLDVFDFELTDADMRAIATLERGERTGPDPDTFIRP